MNGTAMNAGGRRIGRERRTHAGWVMVACLLALALLGGCFVFPIAPRPTVVYAPHPRLADDTLDLETLEEMYTASPDVNPEGLGAMNWIYDQSFMRLVVWPIARLRQERAKVAYQRSEQQQREELGKTQLVFEDNLIFEGVWIGDFAEMLDPARYLPEGVYLVDDRGVKTMAFSAEAVDPWVARTAVRASEFGTAHVSYPWIVFPGNAIHAETKSISLYVALPDRRMRFTWVFDPKHRPPAGQGAGRPGRWSVR